MFKKILFLLIGITLFFLFWFWLKNQNKVQTQTIISCKRAGCSGQLCVDSNSKETVTTCEWSEKYACYQKAVCEVQKDGQCGFTPNEQFQQCLDNLMQEIKK